MNKPTRTPIKRPCRTSRTVLDALLDGVEDHASRTALEAHARECEACQRALDETLDMRSMLDALVDGEATRVDDEAFVASVFADVDRVEDGVPPAVPEKSTAGPWRLVLLGSAAAAAAVLLMLRGGQEDVRRNEPGDERSADARTPRSSDPARAEHAITPTVEGTVQEPGDTEGAPPAKGPVEAERPALTQEDMDAFRLALVEAAEGTDFDPRGQEDAGPFVAAVDSSLADPRRAARMILASVATASDSAASSSPGTSEVPAEALLAARFLGPRSDARDRLMLKRSVADLGAAGAWALVDRGRPGLTTLWTVGLAPLDDDDPRSSDARRSARDVLFAAAKQGRLDLEDLPRARNDAALAAAVILAGSDDSAAQLLSMYLSSGESPWLDAWVGTGGAADSLAAELSGMRGARMTDRRAERLIWAVERSGAASGIAFTLEALEENIEGSTAALAAIDGPEPILALFSATQAGVLRDSAEEQAWTAMVRTGAARVLDATLADAFMANDRAELLLDALVRGTGHSLHSEEQRALGGLGLSAEVFSETRSGALLLLAEKSGPARGPLLPELKAIVAGLRTDADATVCAAAWLVPIQTGEPFPAHVASVLSRSGSVTVKHARLSRAIEKERERIARGSF